MSSPEPDSKRQKVEDGPDPMEEDTAPSTSGKQDQGCHYLMPQYYNRLFPHQMFYKWLVYGNDGKHPQADQSFFQRREFCFTMEGDIFVRYQSFRDGNEMADAIIRKCPAKIDIGPVYTANPQERLKYASTFCPSERELVFDIDLTDYDDVRTCGKGGHICTKCWPLMGVAIQILDRGLREDFGFTNILFVYSGRRGVHCWVCDPAARQLTDEQRSAIASYFSIYKGQEQDKIKVSLGAGGNIMHPAVASSQSTLEKVWPSLLTSQGLLEDETMTANILKLIPDDSTVQAIQEKWKSMKVKPSDDVNLARWKALVQIVNNKVSQLDGQKGAMKLLRAMQKALPEIIFAHAYPRLDMEVSKKMNHLLKAPFCVHPKTGKVCVPIDPADAMSFNPDKVPTVQSLLAELPAKAPGKATEEWVSTSLAPCLKVFESKFLDACSKSSRQTMATLSREKAAAPSFAF